MECITEKRTLAEAQDAIRCFLNDLGVQVVEEIDRPEFWGFWIRFGNFPILIENRKETYYFVVALQITLSPGRETERLNAIYENNDVKTIYELTRAFSSPMTGFSRIVLQGRVSGYAISKYIYPFHPGFSIEDLDEALQAIVSVGAVGVSFLKTLFGDTVIPSGGEVLPPPRQEPQHP
jgi:hypothetical protein